VRKKLAGRRSQMKGRQGFPKGGERRNLTSRRGRKNPRKTKSPINHKIFEENIQKKGCLWIRVEKRYIGVSGGGWGRNGNPR